MGVTRWIPYGIALTLLGAPAARAYPFHRILAGPPAAGTGGPGIQASLGAGNPGAAYLTVKGTRLWLAGSNHNMVRYLQAGTVFGFAGTGQNAFDPVQDGGPASDAALKSPNSVAVDGAGIVYFTSSWPTCPLRYVTNDLVIHTASLPTSTLSQPVDLLVLPTQLLIANQGSGQIISCPLPWDGCQTPTVLQTGFTQPSGIALGPDQKLYVTVWSGVRRFPIGGGLVEVVGPSMSGATGIAVTPDGDVYVANRTARLVQRIRGSVVTPVLGTGQQNLGQVFCAFGSCESTLQPFTPIDVAYDPISGDLYASSAEGEGVVLVDINATLPSPTALSTVTNTPTQVATATQTRTFTLLPSATASATRTLPPCPATATPYTTPCQP